MCACWHLVADDSFFSSTQRMYSPLLLEIASIVGGTYSFMFFAALIFFFLVYEIPRMGTILLKGKVNTERVRGGSHFSYQHRLLRFFLLAYSFCVLGQFLPAFEYVSSLSFSIAFAPALGG